jgi:photosystem II stability/assembly factor-like uncharacterized protein
MYPVAGNPQDPNVLYGNGFFRIYKSTDQGLSWDQSAIGSNWITSIGVDPQDSSKVYAADPYWEGLYRSSDSGASWIQVTGDPPLSSGVSALTVMPGPPTRIYASSYGLLSQSTDGGDHWMNSLTVPQPGPACFLPLSADGTDLLIGTFGGLERSTDSGATWFAPMPDTSSLWVISLAATKSQPNWLVAGTYAGLLRSSDGAASWDLLPTFPPADVRAIAGDALSPGTFFAGTSGNLFRTTDAGGTWAALTGLQHDSIRSLLSVGTNPTSTLAAAGRGVLRSTDSGSSWQPTSAVGPHGLEAFFSPVALAKAPSSRSLVYAADDLTVYRSTDAGETWHAFNERIDPPFVYGVATLAVDPSNPLVVYLAGFDNVLYRSTDGSVTWAPLPSSPFSYGTVISLAVDPANGSRIYAGGDWDGIAQSTDGGMSWSNITNNLRFFYVDQILVDTLTSTIVVAGDGGTALSTDGGDSWAPLGTLPSGVHVQALARSPADPSKLVCGTLEAGAFALTFGDYPIAVGDANGDGHLDVVDVFSLIDFLFAGGVPLPGRPDANGDGHVDIADAFYLINYLFAGGPAPPAI